MVRRSWRWPGLPEPAILTLKMRHGVQNAAPGSCCMSGKGRELGRWRELSTRLPSGGAGGLSPEKVWRASAQSPNTTALCWPLISTGAQHRTSRTCGSLCRSEDIDSPARVRISLIHSRRAFQLGQGSLIFLQPCQGRSPREFGGCSEERRVCS